VDGKEEQAGGGEQTAGDGGAASSAKLDHTLSAARVDARHRCIGAVDPFTALPPFVTTHAIRTGLTRSILIHVG